MQDFQDRQGRLSGKTQKLLPDLEFGGCIGQLEICLYLGKMSNRDNSGVLNYCAKPEMLSRPRRSNPSFPSSHLGHILRITPHPVNTAELSASVEFSNANAKQHRPKRQGMRAAMIKADG